MNFQVLWLWRRVWIFLHPLLKERVSLRPFHWVWELSLNLSILSEVHQSIWIRMDTDLNDSVVIIKNIESEMFVKKVFVLSRVNLAFPFNLPNESPNWKIIKIHLKLVVLAYCFTEFSHLFFSELLIAYWSGLMISIKLKLIRSISKTVSIQYFSKSFLFYPSHFLLLNLKYVWKIYNNILKEYDQGNSWARNKPGEQNGRSKYRYVSLKQGKHANQRNG